jgi:hypothetical protein
MVSPSFPGLASVHIAIVIPAFNLAPFLRDCLLSLLRQTHVNWSAVVVDDGSTDATGAVAAQFADRRIHLIQQANAGVSAARNTGIKAAFNLDPCCPSWPNTRDLCSGHPRTRRRSENARNTNILCPAMTMVEEAGSSAVGVTPGAFLFLDGDDWLAPNALALMAETLEAAPWAVVACGRYARVASNGAVRLAAPPPGGCVLERLVTRNLFANGGHLLIRRDTVHAAGDFRTDLSYGEDLDYWARLAVLGEFVAVRSRAPLLFVRERPGSAYRSHATDPEAYQPAMDAIYRNPAIAARLGASRLANLRYQAEAETAWSVGRELIRHGNRSDGRRWLERSFRAAPNVKRRAVIVLDRFRLRPFRSYKTIG